MIDKLKAARRSGTPLVLITTTDEPATMQEIAGALNGKNPTISYDIVRGFIPLNNPGQQAISGIVADADPILYTDPVTALSAATDRAPDKTAIIALGAQRYLPDAKTQQAIQNARNPFKATGRTLILLCPPGTATPSDLSQDIYSIDCPPPAAETRETIIRDLHTAAGAAIPQDLTQAVTATRGLSPYATEQITALSITPDGLDLAALWARWRATINATPGLTVDQSGFTLDDIGGLESIKTFARQLLAGREPPQAIVRIEEIEKAMSGTGYGSGYGDSSGTSQGILQQLLTEMEENHWSGIIAVGPAGSGKSLCSVALGSAGNIPTITLNLGALKGSLVGQSEAQARKAFSTIKALAGNCFFVTTCNGMATLPTELKRRFCEGIWYFDLPSAEERKKIWDIQIKKYSEVMTILPDDTGWTGAEIRNCVRLAYRLRITPKEAARYIVPVSRMDAQGLERLRKQASGNYLSASTPGPYQYITTTYTATTTRKLGE